MGNLKGKKGRESRKKGRLSQQRKKRTRRGGGRCPRGGEARDDRDPRKSNARGLQQENRRKKKFTKKENGKKAKVNSKSSSRSKGEQVAGQIWLKKEKQPAQNGGRKKRESKNDSMFKWGKGGVCTKRLAREKEERDAQE